MKSRNLALAAAAVAVITGGGTAATVAAEVKLKAASFLPGRASFGAPFFRWVKEVNKQCAGKVNITVVGPSAIKAFEQPNALKQGVIDMLSGPPAYYKGIAIAAETTVLAHVDPVEQRKNGAWAYLNRVHNEKMNAQYLTYVGFGVSFYVYTRKAGKGGRFDGFRMRTAPIYDTFFRGLGATTTKMPPPAVYTALERGAVDGYGWPLWGVTDFGWHKYTKFRYGPGFFNVAVNIIVNLDKWKAMSADQRSCLTNMAMWLEKEFPKWRAAENAKATAAQNKAGIKYIDLGAAHAKKAEELYWAELTKANPKDVSALRNLLTK
ncbi:MAG TPA: TRAP transporter substrate-binding protein DctP [Alphaproteobacteria bacterium]|nr:TRAP transporter substrate-binding protein DctP [Alphaproteobacteria bacterium]